MATSVAVSNARISIRVNGDKPAPALAVLEPNHCPRRREDPLSGLGPFHEHDGVLEVRLEVPPLRRRHAAEAKQIEMGYVRLVPSVAVADGEGRARDRGFDAERAAGAANEGGLSGPELAGDGDDVPRPQA